jgi:hypothetical protein
MFYRGLVRNRSSVRRKPIKEGLLARKDEKRSGEKGRKDQMRKRVESLIYAPDKKMQNSIRPPKSASSIFVVHNVMQRPRY